MTTDNTTAQPLTDEERQFLGATLLDLIDRAPQLGRVLQALYAGEVAGLPRDDVNYALATLTTLQKAEDVLERAIGLAMSSVGDYRPHVERERIEAALAGQPDPYA